MGTELAPLIERAAAALKAAGAREVCLFGSTSKGKLRPGSGVDIAVSGRPRKSSSASWRRQAAPWAARSISSIWTRTRLSADSLKRKGSCNVWGKETKMSAQNDSTKPAGGATPLSDSTRKTTSSRVGLSQVTSRVLTYIGLGLVLATFVVKDVMRE